MPSRPPFRCSYTTSAYGVRHAIILTPPKQVSPDFGSRAVHFCKLEFGWLALFLGIRAGGPVEEQAPRARNMDLSTHADPIGKSSTSCTCFSTLHLLQHPELA